MIPRDFHFAYPLAFLHVLWVLPLLGAVYYALQKNQSALSKWVRPALFSEIVQNPSRQEIAIRILCGVVGWIFIVLALMQPQGNERYLSVQEPELKATDRKSLDVFILIDVSRSMGVKDARNDTSRFEQATAIADQLINQLSNDQIALLTFTNQLIPLVPLTFDKTFLRINLRELTLYESSESGTNLLQTLNGLARQDVPLNSAVYVILSDGGDNLLENSTGEELVRGIKSLEKAAQLIQSPIFTVGVGSIKGATVPNVFSQGKPVVSTLEPELLQAISTASGGRYFSSENLSSQDIAKSIKNAIEQVRFSAPIHQVEGNVTSFTDYFQIPLGLGILCLLFSWWMPPLRSLISIFVISFLAISAVDANLGNVLFEAGRFKDAASWYQNALNVKEPLWIRDKLFFNLGTSYAANHQMQDALRAFFYISPQAYQSQIFQERILNNIAYSRASLEIPLQPLEEVFINLHMAANLSELSQELLVVAREKLAQSIQTATSPQILKSALQDISENQPDSKQIARAAASVALFNLHQSDSPESFLKQLLILLAQIQQQTFFNDQPIADLSEEGKQFFSQVLQKQKKQFNERLCPCRPWDEVLPIFSDGLAFAKEPLLLNAYLQWSEALALLENIPQTQPSNNQKQEVLKALLEMESQDKEKAMQPQFKGEGSSW